MKSLASNYEDYMAFYTFLGANQTNWSFTREAFGASYHKKENQLQPFEKEWTQKVQVMGAYWGNSMLQRYGRT